MISDTHGLLRPEAAEALAGCDHILHAGDIGSDAVLASLNKIAPVDAIRGNVDADGACSALPATTLVEVAGCSFYLVHRREDLDIRPTAISLSAVIFGHSHQPTIEWEKGVLYFNPGSAGPRRFRLPVTVGFLEWSGGKLEPRIETLAV